jgi:hypothetical protein
MARGRERRASAVLASYGIGRQARAPADDATGPNRDAARSGP